MGVHGGEAGGTDHGGGASALDGIDDRLLGVPFDCWFVVLSAWFMSGVLLDGRSHVHGGPETFFTPQHAIFYTAFLGIAGLLGVTIYRRRVAGAAWSNAVPDGYRVSLVGVGLFFVGGIGDLFWHELFGIETSVEALLSPTHLTLFLGGLLFLTGPVRAAWRQPDANTDRWQTLAALVGWGLVLAGFAFLTLYAHPFVRAFGTRVPPAAGGHVHGGAQGFFMEQLGIAGILLQTGALLVGIGLFVRRWPRSLPTGWITLLFAITVGATVALGGPPGFVLVALGAGVVADGLYRRLDLRRTRDFRLFGAAVPVVLWSLYFGALGLTVGLGWAIHAWGGAILLGGFVGVVVTYLLDPPAMPMAATE
ncbi:MAG: hypothetical protein ABEI77_06305 [Halorientalis sp.]